jgi:hypothetical protein
MHGFVLLSRAWVYACESGFAARENSASLALTLSSDP